MERVRRAFLFLVMLAIFAMPLANVSGKSTPAPALTSPTAVPKRDMRTGIFTSLFGTATSQEGPQNEPEDSKVVYLTFDDGPDPALQVLARYHAGATFYMVGRNAHTYPQLIRQIAESKQTIGIHGYNHLDMAYLDYQTFFAEVHDTEVVILDALDDEPGLTELYGKCLRPPYGRTSEYLYRNAQAMEYTVSMWNIDTKDWQQPDPTEMLNSLLKGLEPGKVILMHDGGQERSKTLTGLQLILHELIMQGYQILPYCTSEGQAHPND